MENLTAVHMIYVPLVGQHLSWIDLLFLLCFAIALGDVCIFKSNFNGDKTYRPDIALTLGCTGVFLGALAGMIIAIFLGIN